MRLVLLQEARRDALERKRAFREAAQLGDDGLLTAILADLTTRLQRLDVAVGVGEMVTGQTLGLGTDEGGPDGLSRDGLAGALEADALGLCVGEAVLDERVEIVGHGVALANAVRVRVPVAGSDGLAERVVERPVAVGDTDEDREVTVGVGLVLPKDGGDARRHEAGQRVEGVRPTARDPQRSGQR